MDKYISREAVFETIRYRVCQGHGNKEHICKRGSCAYCGIMEIMNDIESIKAADVQPVKHGRWIWLKNYRDCEGDIYAQYKCSCCDFVVGNAYSIEDLTHFCGNCGADMRTDGDSDD